LQRQLLKRIDETAATKFGLFELYGETEEIIDYYEPFQNAVEATIYEIKRDFNLL
jgi:hypothetical protein